jgi:hypothetical protein
MPIKLKGGNSKLMNDVYGLQENPFRTAPIYSIDRRGTYVPEMYGDQYGEFYQKFFLNPLSKETNKQVIGALWSTHSGDSFGKGFGKSMLMAEESMRINEDLGASKLRESGVDEGDILENPFVAGYCTFDQAKDVKSFAAALLDAVVFILESTDGKLTLHQKLRERICAQIEVEEGFESESIETALSKELRRYRGLNIQLTHATVRSFIERLCHDDTEGLVEFIRHEIGPRVKANQGFNFVHIFNAFLMLAGIVYVVYFVDQIENFAKFARNQERDLKILRESICQTSPTAEFASFVFQMHVQALQVIEDWWDNIEHLPSLDASKPINTMRIVDLKGLTTAKEAATLAARYLAEKRVSGVRVAGELHPFDEDIVEAVRQSVKGNPRKFLEQLGAILDNAADQKRKKIDLPFVQPYLDGDSSETSVLPEDEEYSNVER